MALLGHVPKVGEHIEDGGFRYEVVDMDGRRIDKLLVSRSLPPGGEGEV
jgi:putative hemolysin